MINRKKMLGGIFSLSMISMAIVPFSVQAAGECAAYQDESSQTVSGVFDGLDCTYSTSFSDAGKNLTTSMTIPFLANGGAHIFEGSLFVGNTHDTDSALAAAGINEGGDGPILTVEAGVTVAFTSNSDFLIVNRGSQLRAIGTIERPVTFTSVSDVESSRETIPTLAFDAVQQWGGMVINGFGVTNKCSYTGSVADGDLATTDCHVDAEGAAGLDESQYGGANNSDNSGQLEYMIVKHTGAQVANGDELNGISFGGVGSGTVVKNLQVYSTFDDGIEMFGGAVSFENYVALYVRDDSIDIDEGWSGTITNALVIQAEADGNHCIEADGIGSFSSLSDSVIEGVIDQGINSRPVIKNLTCIISPNGSGSATHDPGAGWRLREGLFPTISDSMVVAIGADSSDSSTDNYCLRVDNRSQTAFVDGDLDLDSTIFACNQKTRDATLDNGNTVEQQATNTGSQFATVDVAGTDPTTGNLTLLEGPTPIYSVAFADMLVDGAAPTVPTPTSGFIGAVQQSNDWTATWTYGIHAGNRSTVLWFVQDADGDGFSDGEDAFPNDASESVDTDLDGIGNNTDTDDDNDGVNDASDVFPLDVTESKDTDLDGIGDNADSDADGNDIVDIDEIIGSRFGNIATRGFVGTGDNVLIAGVIINGTRTKTVVIRAKGPSLTALGVNGALANPQVILLSGSTVIESNNDWRDHANAASLPTDLQPTDDLEATIYVDLAPGAYTAIVSGVGNLEGIGIVEVFEVFE